MEGSMVLDNDKLVVEVQSGEVSDIILRTHSLNPSFKMKESEDEAIAKAEVDYLSIHLGL